MAAGIIHEIKRHATAGAAGQKQTKDILVVTLVSSGGCQSARFELTFQDQRNHGERERLQLDPPFDTNPNRLAHMAATVSE